MRKGGRRDPPEAAERRAPRAARREVRLRRGHRRQQPDADGHRPAEADRPDRRHRADQGETGTGKELVAQAIHQNSPRKGKRFVALNCAAVGENILESELFGHVKGAFTDAHSDRVGEFEYANGGTLFLDEVGDMPMATQIKLLRVLEERQITRVGDNEPIRVNVRLVSATNRNLEELIAAGTFRSDLYHRLKVVTVDLPRLARAARGHLPLADHFRRQFAKRHHKTIKSMSTAGAKRLLWLRLAGQRAAAAQRRRKHGRGRLRRRARRRRPAAGAGRRAAAAARPSPPAAGRWSLIGRTMDEIERWAIAETLKLTGGNREEAAEMLGIGERTLYRKMEKYQVGECEMKTDNRIVNGHVVTCHSLVNGPTDQ